MLEAVSGVQVGAWGALTDDPTQKQISRAGRGISRFSLAEQVMATP